MQYISDVNRWHILCILKWQGQKPAQNKSGPENISLVIEIKWILQRKIVKIGHEEKMKMYIFLFESFKL